MVNLEFIHVPDGRTKDVGPYPFVQVTYDEVRVGEDGEQFIAVLVDGYWEYGGELWTDFCISAVEAT